MINGGFQVAQRATSSTSAGYTTVDRWKDSITGQDEQPTRAHVTLTSSDTGPWAKGFRNAWQITNGNQSSGADAGDKYFLEYRFEAQDIANSNWDYTSASSYATLSFWVKSSVAQTFQGYLLTLDGTNYKYPFNTGALGANTWTKVTKTIPGNSNLQIDNDNGGGFLIVLAPFIGTDFTDSVSDNAWSAYASGARTNASASTWWTTNNSTFALTGFQFESGETATEFEHRLYAQELQLCKRYYQKHAPVNADHMIWGWGRAESNTGRIGLPIAVPMRATPTVYAAKNRLMKYQGTASDSTDTPSVLTNWVSESNVYTIDFGGHSLDHNNMYNLTSNTDSGITLSSEL